MITHHPSTELLVDYASGALSEGPALAVATHLALCESCRALAARLDAVGGSLIDGLMPTALGPGALESAVERLDCQEQPLKAVTSVDDDTRRLVPAPLRGYLGRPISALSWRSVGTSVYEARLTALAGSFRASLLRIKPGRVIPKHGHAAEEYTVVLAGGYTDAGARYTVGDFHFADETLQHSPVADPGTECLCFSVLSGPIRLISPLGRLLGAIARI